MRVRELRACTCGIWNEGEGVCLASCLCEDNWGSLLDASSAVLLRATEQWSVMMFLVAMVIQMLQHMRWCQRGISAERLGVQVACANHSVSPWRLCEQAGRAEERRMSSLWLPRSEQGRSVGIYQQLPLPLLQFKWLLCVLWWCNGSDIVQDIKMSQVQLPSGHSSFM